MMDRASDRIWTIGGAVIGGCLLLYFLLEALP